MKISKTYNFSHLTEAEEKELEKKQLFKNISLVVFGSIIYSVSFVWILQLCGFFAGGITGTSQLIVSLVGKFSTNTKVVNFFTNNIGSLVLILNVPLLIIGSKGVSKKFAIFTTVSLVLQTLCMNLLNAFTISPIVALFTTGQDIVTNAQAGTSAVGKGLFELIQDGSFHLFKAADYIAPERQIFIDTMLPGTKILLAITGGALCAVGAAMTLKGGGSTGGMDVIANYLYKVKRISFTKIELAYDTTIISLSGIISVENVLFTLIRLYTYMLVLKQMYRSYNIKRIDIISANPDQITDMLFKEFPHSYTKYECIGGYTNSKKYCIVIYASEFEVDKYINYIKDADPKAFVAVTAAEIHKSNFVQHTIC